MLRVVTSLAMFNHSAEMLDRFMIVGNKGISETYIDQTNVDLFKRSTNTAHVFRIYLSTETVQMALVVAKIRQREELKRSCQQAGFWFPGCSLPLCLRWRLVDVYYTGLPWLRSVLRY